jgi:hypothetical protein
MLVLRSGRGVRAAAAREGAGVTEVEWQTGTTAWPMLSYLAEEANANPRKLRLFACACWSRLSHLLWDERLRRFLQMLELCADGRVRGKEKNQILKSARIAVESSAESRVGSAREREVAEQMLGYGLAKKASDVSYRACFTAHRAATWIGDWAVAAEEKAQCELLREVFGNPFRPVVLDPSWFAWQDGAVRKLARVIYEEHRFGDLPVLADALEEAGCTEPELLGHLRGPGPHVRGCWALDLVLATE